MLLLNAIILLFSIYSAYSWMKAKETFPNLNEKACTGCPRLYAPVCGSDNRTFVNICKLNCFNSYFLPHKRVHIRYYGPCTMLRRSFSQDNAKVAMMEQLFGNFYDPKTVGDIYNQSFIDDPLSSDYKQFTSQTLQDLFDSMNDRRNISLMDKALDLLNGRDQNSTGEILSYLVENISDLKGSGAFYDNVMKVVSEFNSTSR